MTVTLGPILGFVDVRSDLWTVSALYVRPAAEAQEQLSWSIDGTAQAPASPILLHQHKDQDVVRYELKIPLGPREQKVAYGLSAEKDGPFSFCVPAIGASPQMAYASCNGFSDPKDMKMVADKNAMWSSMKEQHERRPYHLLLMGGDQIYADSIWKKVSTIERWSEKPIDDRRSAAFTQTMERQVDDFYFDLYCDRWKQREVARMFAETPTVMMWDDHDIFDGWGSYDTDDLSCAVYQGIFRTARKYFAVFQRQIPPDGSHAAGLPNQPGFSAATIIGKVGILIPDLRSERTPNQVMSPQTWDAVTKWLDGLAPGSIDHLLVMSSIPVVHPDLSWAETIFNWLPGQQELEDDLRDHWNSRPHREERLRLVHRLLKTAKEKSIRATLLSGDVHVAALGVILSDRHESSDRSAAVINQLTSSAIVHPAPPGVMNALLELLGRFDREIDREITVRMLTFPGTSERFLTSRNWLSIEPDTNDQRRLWANFHVEGETHPYTKVIHAIENTDAIAAVQPAQAA